MRCHRPVIVCVWALVFSSACGGGTARREDPRPEQPAVGAHERSVASTDFGSAWPLTVDQGILACVDGSSVIFKASGITYAVNGRARGRLAEQSWREVEAITKTAQLTGVPSVARLDVPTRREIFRRYLECEDAKSSRAISEGCKRALQASHHVSAQELSIISTEGLSHSWPPLKPIYVSLQPLITAGLALCR